MASCTPAHAADEVNVVITRVVATLQDCGPEMVGRFTLGNVAAYLLQWALMDLSREQQDEAMNNFLDHVEELLGMPSSRQFDA